MSNDEINIKSIKKLLEENGYIPNNEIATTIYLSFLLKKPILIEGPPGVGKTELSKAIAKSFNKEFFRVQCYEGITFEQIIGEWNYQKQLLHLETTKENGVDEKSVFSEEYFIRRPLLNAFMNTASSIILIDEIDKADEEVESFLLQALGEGEITVNDLGTFPLNNDLIFILTSNSQRILLDETKDRCLYLYINYPSFDREVAIVSNKVPNASEPLVKRIVSVIQRIRSFNLSNKPSIRASVDWVKSVLILNTSSEEVPDDSVLEDTLNVVVKNETDKKKIEKELF